MLLSLSRVGATVLRQLYLLRASPVRVLPLFAWAAIDIVLWGFITLYLDSIVISDLKLVSTLLGAVLLWSFFGRVMHGVTTAFLEDVWSRNFLNLFASPLTIAEYISSLVITSVLTSLVGLVVMLVLAALAFGLSFAVYGNDVIAFPVVTVLVWCGARCFCQRHGTAFWTSVGVVRLAYASAVITVRRCVLSISDAAKLDATGWLCLAAIVCVRRYARDRPDWKFLYAGPVL